MRCTTARGHRLGGVGFVCLVGLVSLLARSASAQDDESPQRRLVVAGPVVVGNGLPNGAGATLGRIFLKVRGLDDPAADSLPIEVALSSASVRVDPTTCAASSDEPCQESGVGLAVTGGRPSVVQPTFAAIKLAGALYLPFFLGGRQSGSSLEIALEGGLTVGSTAARGTPCRLKLALANPRLLHTWALRTSSVDASNVYIDETGTGLVLSDVFLSRILGELNGTVVDNSRRSLTVALGADALSLDNALDQLGLELEPDYDAAAAAGLPDGSFLIIELNYSGLPTRSNVYEGANSADVEVHQTARAVGTAFVRGDCNSSGAASHFLVDAIFFLDYGFSSGPAPLCLEACDSNGDGQISPIVDSVYLLNFAFGGGPAPPAPYPHCDSPYSDHEPPPSQEVDCALPPDCT